MTAYVGDIVQFNCRYTGTNDVPFWRIGGSGYIIDDLPRRHSYSGQVLTVHDVQLTDSGQTYQCTFLGPESRTATLTVLPTAAGKIVFRKE